MAMKKVTNKSIWDRILDRLDWHDDGDRKGITWRWSHPLGFLWKGFWCWAFWHKSVYNLIILPIILSDLERQLYWPNLFTTYIFEAALFFIFSGVLWALSLGYLVNGPFIGFLKAREDEKQH